MTEPVRGSRLHVLDWTGQDRAALCKSVNAMLKGTGAKLREDNAWMPQGHANPAEGKLNELCPEYISPEVKADLMQWWLVHTKGANVPNWDFLATCSIDGKPGLILLEAKAHETELSSAGKLLRSDASENSEENHEHIGNAIATAKSSVSRALKKQGISTAGLKIHRDSCYQLSNRVAWSWKLASLGVPVVLIYLGFTGDTYFDSDFLKSGKNWEEVTQEHFKKVLPEGFVNSKIAIKDCSMQMVVQSLPVERVSPSQ